MEIERFSFGQVCVLFFLSIIRSLIVWLIIEFATGISNEMLAKQKNKKKKQIAKYAHPHKYIRKNRLQRAQTHEQAWTKIKTN